MGFGRFGSGFGFRLGDGGGRCGWREMGFQDFPEAPGFPKGFFVFKDGALFERRLKGFTGFFVLTRLIIGDGEVIIGEVFSGKNAGCSGFIRCFGAHPDGLFKVLNGEFILMVFKLPEGQVIVPVPGLFRVGDAGQGEKDEERHETDIPAQGPVHDGLPRNRG